MTPQRGPQTVFLISGSAKIRYSYNAERRDVLGNTPPKDRPREEICLGVEGLCTRNPRDGLRANFDCCPFYIWLKLPELKEAELKFSDYTGRFFDALASLGCMLDLESQ